MREFEEKSVREQVTQAFERLSVKQEYLEESAFRLLNSADSVERLIREINECMLAVADSTDAEEKEINLARTMNSLKNLSLLSMELNKYAHRNEEGLGSQKETIDQLQQIADYVISFL